VLTGRRATWAAQGADRVGHELDGEHVSSDAGCTVHALNAAVVAMGGMNAAEHCWLRKKVAVMDGERSIWTGLGRLNTSEAHGSGWQAPKCFAARSGQRFQVTVCL